MKPVTNQSSVIAQPASSPMPHHAADSSAQIESSPVDAPTIEPVIHPTAIVASDARIGRRVHIGAYCIIGQHVTLEDDVRLESHVHIDGRTIVGEGTRVFPFVSIGLAPQDLKYDEESSETRIGRRTTIREFVTVHRGTAHGGMLTTVGDNCLLMAQAHVAHDCHVGNNVIMANAATLAGHVTVAEHATIGAYSGVHQFCRVGREAFIGGYSVVVKDALPFAKTVGNHARCYGLNTVGLKRRGFAPESIRALSQAFRLLLAAKLNTTQALERIITSELNDTPEVRELITFIQASQRGVIK
ncbi:MAG: acyl-ACP--UDP-N-acetylglucosamine O-acyltransferase [Pyrinomonadaceae bacterium MAG19_C2-C3]|nr:acyl-ACP--UDP-N-acetylglucosamine O-acyltransferase [Pyrinomonadaceae bacterium MAG19_C2-C3]